MPVNCRLEVAIACGLSFCSSDFLQKVVSQVHHSANRLDFCAVFDEKLLHDIFLLP